MRRFLTSAAIVLALAGTSFAIATPASADGFSVTVGNNNGYDNYRHRSGATISVGFGDAAFGYRDGYWDNGHRWHRWNNDRDYRNYRNHHAGSYSDWNHDRYGGDGWQGNGYSNGYSDISLAYRDGYWDNSHRWHRWNNDRDYRHYRGQHGSNYHDWNHDRDRDNGWQRH